MSEYTPDTASLRYAWRKHRDQVAAKGNMSAYSAEFDRWLAAHDAGVKAEAWDEGLKHTFYDASFTFSGLLEQNFYREETK